ncbi:MAG TPA: hypothetical protein VML54_01445, partial [Candidatus Limnocylindrales bacterium]|nr:hypothetical protein [Candidatus Limnocylindrales bacterium]
TFDQVLELALDTAVKRLFFFHHSPERSDAELEGILADMRGRVKGRGLQIDAADEGDEVSISDSTREGFV